MKKRAGIFLCIIFLFVLSACSRKEEDMAYNPQDTLKKEDEAVKSLQDSKKENYVTEKEISIMLQDTERKGIYTGEIKNGLPDGEGEFETENSSGTHWVYKGEWKNGKMDGEGICRWESGRSYEGSYKDGLQDGEGTISKNGTIIYNGLFRQGTAIELARTDSSNTDSTDKNFIKFEDYKFSVPKNWETIKEEENYIEFSPEEDDGATISVTVSEKRDVRDLNVRNQLISEYSDKNKKLLGYDDCEVMEDNYRDEEADDYEFHLILYKPGEENTIVDVYYYIFETEDSSIIIETFLGDTTMDYSNNAKKIKNGWKKMDFLAVYKGKCSNYFTQLKFQKIIDLCEKYIKEKKPSDNDGVYEVLELIKSNKDMTKNLVAVTDEFKDETVVYYKDLTEISSKNHFISSFERGDLSFEVGFVKNDWLFFDEAILKCGDSSNTIDLSLGERTRDVLSGRSIIEYANAGIMNEEKRKMLLENLENEVSIRFYGDGDKTVDYTLSKTEKKAIKALNNFYQLYLEYIEIK